MKEIQIGCCAGCLHFSRRSCVHPKFESKYNYIDNLTIIHPDCPLEDYNPIDWDKITAKFYKSYGGVLSVLVAAPDPYQILLWFKSEIEGEEKSE